MAAMFLAFAGCQTGGGGGGGLDSDGDGFTDTEERNALPGSDPFNPNDTPLNPIDTDGDGCSDFDELNFEDFCDNDPNTDVDEPPPGATNTFSLRVRRHVDQPLSAGAVDGIFSTASRLLQVQDNGCRDVAAEVAFVRVQEIDTFDEANSVVTTEAQLDRLFELDGDFKVVEAMIGVCGAGQDDQTTLLGCAFEGGSVVIIADAPPDVWAHEWGHVQGLDHRDDCTTNIMHAVELNTDAVNQFERNAFLSPGPRNTTGKQWLDALKFSRDSKRSANLSAEAATIQAATPGAPDVPPNAWLANVVTRRYRSGIPAAWANQFSALAPGITTHSRLTTHPSRLPQWLTDPAYAAHRANVARLIGLSGDRSAVPALIASVAAPTGSLSREQFNGCVESILALGRLVSADDSGMALEFLIAGTDPQSWATMPVGWSFGSYDGMKRNELLSRLSIMALGLSKSPVATAHLRGLREGISAGIVSPTQLDQIEEAIERAEGRHVRLKSGVTPMP